jgi:hypothetical protein
MVFGLILAILLGIGMTIYSMKAEDIGLYGIIGPPAFMILLMWGIAFRTYSKEMTAFEGLVYKVKEKKKTETDNNNTNISKTYYKYILYVKKSRGGKIKYQLLESSKPSEKGRWYLSYYKDQNIKKYPAIDLPERRDPLADQKLCIFCGTLNHTEDHCTKCNTPLPQ